MSEAYSNFHDHLGMLLDDVRNAVYEKAIKSVVNRDSVVLDLGAGLGLHGLMAARAGARKVYLVDPSPVLSDARRVAEANGFGEQLEFINAAIETVELPEKVDVIVSVLTGNFLVAEDLLPTLFLARDRWLKPGGAMVPDVGAMMVMPIAISKPGESPLARLENRIFDIDYSMLRHRAIHHVHFGRHEPDKFTALGEAQVLNRLDLRTADSSRVDQSLTLKIEQPGQLAGIVGWLDLGFGELILSTGPMAERVHWRQAHMALDKAVEVKQGDEVNFSLKRPEYGDWTWTVEVNGQRQRMSTFLGRVISKKLLANAAMDHAPSLSDQGRAASFVLDRMDGNASVSDLARALLGSDACHVPNEQAATLFVQSIIERFAPG